MTLVKFNNRPVSKSFNSVFDDLLNQFPSVWNDAWTGSGTVAPVNIHETKDAYHLEMSVPGVTKEDFTVKLEKGILSVGFEKKEETKSEDYKTVRREFTQRSFTRSFHVDENIDASKIEAKYENGILKLLLPRQEQVKPAAQQISVQ
ncbi:MAG: Hsp20/alpha crystallin family protein [Chitinophagaceae bacterium]